MALISLLHPSRGRPEKSNSNSRKWVSTKGEGVDVEVIVSLDGDDKSDYDSIYFQEEPQCHPVYHPFESHVTLVYNYNKSVVEATNYAAKKSKGEILIYLSDDFDCPENWGPLVLKEFESVEGPCLLKVDDCLQPFNVRVLTIPIMNRALYDRLGYFWNPEYKSMFVDQDLYEVCAKNGWLKFVPHLKFPHNHHSVGKAQNDETYKRSEANWNQGQEVFRRRQRQGFPI